jgi:hypothetical protein
VCVCCSILLCSSYSYSSNFFSLMENGREVWESERASGWKRKERMLSGFWYLEFPTHSLHYIIEHGRKKVEKNREEEGAAFLLYFNHFTIFAIPSLCHLRKSSYSHDFYIILVDKTHHAVLISFWWYKCEL